MRILIVEDQDNLRHILFQRLNEEGYVVDQAPDGLIAQDYIESTKYDLIILDLMLPHISGLELLKQMRHRGNHTPVLCLTAKDSLDDRITGLDSGADDYLTKPFASSELLARIRALLRRRESEVSSVITLSDLELNRTTKEVTRSGQKINLTKKEYAILEYLLLHKEKMVSRSMIEDHTSNYDYEGYSNVIDVYIRFLRKKIDDGHETKLIHTVRGFGYILKVEK